jgi:hypothetical protein
MTRGLLPSSRLREGAAGTFVFAPGHAPRAPLRALFALALAVAAVRAGDARAQSTLSALQTDVDRIASAARPSVVTVMAQRALDQRPRPGAPLERHVLTRVGSGVTVSESEILTTASVVLGA